MIKILFTLVLLSCSSSSIKKNEDNTFTSRYSDLDKDNALEEAIENAKDYCGSKRILYVARNVDYVGEIPEEENKKIKNNSNKSIILEQGGLDQAEQTEYSLKKENLYKAEVIFRCGR